MTRFSVKHEVRKSLSNPTMLDRLVEYVSPSWARKRLNDRAAMAMAGAFLGGSRSRRQTTEWNTNGGSANADILPELDLLRQRSRDMERNCAIAAGAINTVVSNSIGIGIRARPKIDRWALGITESEAKAFEDAALLEWRLFAESTECDATSHGDFYDLQSMIFRNVLVNGDAITLLVGVKNSRTPYALKLQVIESDRICNPNWTPDTEKLAGGVEMNEMGEPIRYHVLKQHPGALNRNNFEWLPPIQARTGRGTKQVLHHFERRRPGQARGIPYLAPVIEPLKMLDRYSEAEIMAAVISGMFSVFVTTEAGDGMDSMLPLEGSSASTSTSDYKLAPGAILDLRPGEKIEVADPKRPNQAFDAFVQAILRQVGVALELPFEVLVKHYTSSYTAARAAILDAWKFFTVRRAWLSKSLCRPVYEAWMEESVAKGRLSAPGFFTDPIVRMAYLGCQWIGPAPGSIDPIKEAKAAEIRMNIDLSTLENETVAYDGGDWEDNLVQRAAERKIQAENAPVLPGVDPKQASAPDKQAVVDEEDPDASV